MNGCRAAMAAGRPRGPDAGPGDHRAHRPHAARAPRSPPRSRRSIRCAPTSSASTAPPGRPRWASTSATCPSTPACPSRCCRTPGSRRSSTARCTTTSAPRSSSATSPGSSTTSASTSSVAAAAPRRSTSASSPTAVEGLTPTVRTPEHEDGVASMYSFTPFRPEGATAASSFTIIGERTNANGSKKFREALLDGDWDLTAQMAKDQVREGANIIDVCVDYVGRDGTLDMDEVARRFTTQSSVAARHGLDRAAGHGGRPPVARRPLDPQLGEPRGRRARGLAARPRVQARPHVRVGGHLPAHRRGGPGPRRRVEDAHRPPHPRPGHQPLRARVGRHHLRRAHLPALDRRRRPPPRRDQHHRGHPPHQGGAARHVHDAGRVERQLRPLPRLAPRPQQRVHPRVRRGRARLGHRPRRQDPPAQPHPRGAARRLPRPRSGTAAAPPASCPTATRATTRWPSCSTSSPT